MLNYQMKHNIVNCENTDSVASHDLYPTISPVTTVTPPWSMTYFMNGPFLLIYQFFLIFEELLSGCQVGLHDLIRVLQQHTQFP